MAAVKFLVRGTSISSKVYCRFYHGRAYDVKVATPILVNPNKWDKTNGKLKYQYSENALEVNEKLNMLSALVIKRFNESYFIGDIINSLWLRNIINEAFNRPKIDFKEKATHAYYYTDFAKWWLINHSGRWLTSSKSYMTEGSKKHYRSHIKMIEKFQGKTKIKFNQNLHETLLNYIDWMVENSYSSETIKRHIRRFRFFCNRATEKEFRVNQSYNQKVFIPKKEDILDPYLNFEELKKIASVEMPNEELDNARDNLIIGCWTGLRVSDYLHQLDLSNFIDDFIEIKTKKTGANVAIPIHRSVKNILIKRKGRLPDKVNDQKFNQQIKEVCRIAGITDIIRGRKFDSTINRKVVGLYKKYELISSHIGRRSFATNHYGKLSNDIIMSIGGWSQENMLLQYIKRSNRDSAKELKKYWEENKI